MGYWFCFCFALGRGVAIILLVVLCCCDGVRLFALLGWVFYWCLRFLSRSLTLRLRFGGWCALHYDCCCFCLSYVVIVCFSITLLV